MARKRTTSCTVLVLVFLASLAGSAFAIYEEQAGKYDFHRTQIGRVTNARFAFRGRNRVFVSTDAAVVAALDLRSGEVAWRQVLEKTEQVDQLYLLPKPAAVASFSRSRGYLRVWNAADGVLLWDHHIGEPKIMRPPLVAICEGVDDRASTVALLAQDRLQVRAGTSGKLLWTSEVLPPSGPAGASLSHQIILERSFLNVVLLDDRVAHVVAFASGPEGWREAGRSTIKLPVDAGSVVPLGASGAAALSMDGSKLCRLSWTREASSEHVDCAPVEAAFSAAATGHSAKPARLVHLEGSEAVAVVGPGGVALYTAPTDSTGLKQALFAAGALAVSQPLEVNGDTLVAISRPAAGSQGSQAGEEGIVHVVSLSSGQAVETLDVQGLGLASASGARFGLDFVALGKGPSDIRVLAGAEEGSLALLEGQGVAWTREEALAAVRAALFVDLPAPSAELEAQQRNSGPTLLQRFQAELLAAKEQLGFSQPEDRAKLAALRAKSSERSLPTRDAAGFRKQIVILSNNGKLLGLHSGDGRVLWSAVFDPACPPTHLKLWRSSHDAVHAPEVMVLGNGEEGACYTVVDAHSGKALDGGALPAHISQVLEGPQVLLEDTTEQRVLLLVSADESSPADSAPRLHVLPDTGAARDLLLQSPVNLHNWQANASSGTVSGYHIGGALKAELTWSAAFASDSDRLLAAVTQAAGESVYSHAKVLGNRSLKLKYLNPNLLLIAAGPPGGTPGRELAFPRLTISILDTVSGEVLYRQSHQDARGPVHAVLCENWAVYHFWSIAHHRHEMAVIELYDATPRDLSVADVLFSEGNVTQSAFAPPPLEALTQTFAIREGVRGMAPVATQRGITAKLLLLATSSDQLYMMDKRFLDPRRPKGTPTKEDQAEMLVPFDPELPMNPLLFASHQHSIARVSGIVTSPAVLESTALVLAHGLDIFVTRVQPSRNFDLIPDDFPYALLITISAVLAIAALALKRVEVSSSISKKWT